MNYNRESPHLRFTDFPSSQRAQKLIFGMDRINRGLSNKTCKPVICFPGLREKGPPQKDANVQSYGYNRNGFIYLLRAVKQVTFKHVLINKYITRIRKQFC